MMETNDTLTTFNKLLKEDKKTKTNHHLVLFHNKQCNLDSEIHYEASPFQCSLPLISLNNLTETAQDLNLKSINDKKQWNDCVKFMKHNYNLISKNRRLNYFQCKTSKTTVPLYLMRFTKLLNDDPDPYFNSHYNWYYSGNGNLCIINYDTLQTIKAVKDALYIHDFNDNFDGKENTSYFCSNKDVIYETQYFDKHYYIGLRQKFTIHLMKYNISDTTGLESFKTLKSDIPYTSFDIGNDRNKIYYSCANNFLYYYDTEADQIYNIYTPQENTKCVTNWSSIKNIDENTLIHTTNSDLFVFDIRNKYIPKIYNLINDSDCKKITSLRRSAYPNYIYLGTAHNLQIYDIRYLDKTVREWTHGLKSPPLFMSSILTDNGELITVSSQLPDDSCFIFNNNHLDANHGSQSEGIKYSNVLPWHPPSAYDAYKTCKLKGFCLDPNINLEQRISAFQTGNIIIELNKKYHLFKLNSLGDIFHQTIFKNMTPDLKEDEVVDSWSKKILPLKEVTVTDSVDFSKFHVRIRRKRKKRDIKKRRVRDSTTKNWDSILTYMSECTDMCAHELLSVWDLNLETSVCQNNDDINKWLQQDSTYIN